MQAGISAEPSLLRSREWFDGETLAGKCQHREKGFEGKPDNVLRVVRINPVASN